MVACGRHEPDPSSSPARPQPNFGDGGPLGDAIGPALARALTDSTIKGIKAPASGRVEVADLRCAGLSFRITAAGIRSWSFRFQGSGVGQGARSTIGHYPDISLGDARKAADLLRGKVAEGVNPIVEKAGTVPMPAVRRFRPSPIDISKSTQEGSSARPMLTSRNFRLHVLPKWAKRRYDHIERADVIELVEGIVKAGSPVQANRVQALISMVFSFAIDAGLMEFNPCSRLRKRGAENRETRVLSDVEIREFWRQAVLPPVTRRVGLALRLTLLTGCRPGEAAGINRNELSYLNVADGAGWLLPPGRSKNGRAHDVPLSELARSTVLSAIDLISDDDEFVFPSPVEAAGPITGHALTVAMRRMKEKIKGEALQLGRLTTFSARLTPDRFNPLVRSWRSKGGPGRHF